MSFLSARLPVAVSSKRVDRYPADIFAAVQEFFISNFSALNTPRSISEESWAALDRRSSPVTRAAVMGDNFRLFYGEYGGRLERQLVELTERFSDRINEDPALKSVILFFVISFVLLAFLILFISLFLAVGCICVLTYFFMTTLSSFTPGVTRN